MNVIGRVHSIETFTTLDGPGIRYLLFLQGCLLRCKSCSNADTWPTDKGAIFQASEIIANLKNYKDYIEGITISGGEPLLQPKFVSKVLEETQNIGLNTCIDTAGQSGRHSWDMVLPYTNTVLMCLKHINPIKYEQFTGAKQRHALDFIERMNEKNIPFYFRYLLIPKFSDDMKDIDKFIQFAHKQPMLKGIELLPYHRLGVNKWKGLGMEYELDGVLPPSKETVATIREHIRQSGLKVV